MAVPDQTAAKRGYESRRSLSAYDRKFKHGLRAGLEISQLTKGFVGKAGGLEVQFRLAETTIAA
jgi:hypothetical protein